MRCVFSGNLDVQPGAGALLARGVLARLLQPLAALRNDFTTTTFPDDCRVCAGPLTAYAKTPVCTACIAAVRPEVQPLCQICGEALGMESARFAGALGGSSCTACRMVPPAYARAVAYAAYEDELRELLHLLKYGRMQRLAAAPLGEWLASAIALLRNDAAGELLVMAVPLWPARERERGFNQSVLLADAATAALRKRDRGWKLTSAHGLLRRTRDTEAQFSLQPRARRANLRGAFAATDSAALEGREVLLIDDIMTTGATARECARVLLRAGAAKVWVATLARAQAEASTMFEPDVKASTTFGGSDVARWGAT